MVEVAVYVMTAIGIPIVVAAIVVAVAVAQVTVTVVVILFIAVVVIAIAVAAARASAPPKAAAAAAKGTQLHRCRELLTAPAVVSLSQPVRHDVIWDTIHPGTATQVDVHASTNGGQSFVPLPFAAGQQARNLPLASGFIWSDSAGLILGDLVLLLAVALAPGGAEVCRSPQRGVRITP